MVEVDTLGFLFQIVTMIGILVPVFLIVWNMSKKFTGLEKDNEVGKEQHIKDIENLKDYINKEVQSLKETRTDLLLQYSEKLRNIESLATNRIAETRLETKEEVGKAMKQTKEECSVIQKQVDTIKSDIKDVSTRITTVNTKTEYIENEIRELKECDASNHKFHSDWNQRIEDTDKEIRREIGTLRNEFLHMFVGFHGGKNENGNDNK